MLSFKSFLPDDKDFGHSTRGEDSCTDLFEQYLNNDPIGFSDTIQESDGFQAFDFAFDEETESSESCSADSKNAGYQTTQQPQLSTSFNQAPLEQPSPLRVRSRLLSRDASGPAISGNELLNLEGKVHTNSFQTQTASTFSAPSVVPKLRRKSNFCEMGTGNQRRRSQKISKTSSAEMLQHSAHRHESPSYNDWAQRFEQINIQNPMGDNQSTPPRNTGTYREKRPDRILTTFNHESQQQQAQSQQRDRNVNQPLQTAPAHSNYFNAPTTAPLPHGWQSSSQPSPMQESDYNFSNKRPPLERSQTQQLRHAPSWGYSGPVSPLTPDFPVPSSHIQPQWLHDLPEDPNAYATNNNAFYSNTNSHNNSIPQSTPQLPANPDTDFTSPGLGFEYESYNNFINEDPSTDYAVLSSDGFFSPSTIPPRTINPNNHLANHNGLPSTPPPNSHSTSPQPPLSPSKSHLRSKSIHHPHTPSHRRQKSMSALTHKASKSLSLSHPSSSHQNLKTPKSATTLRNPKSSSSLNKTTRSPSKSAAGGGGGGDNGGFGFVNFTSADKGKILTGVAPSGSSKTKARRELEAAEKKRRLSAAALRAVKEAGGDVGVLRGLGVGEFEEF